MRAGGRRGARSRTSTFELLEERIALAGAANELDAVRAAYGFTGAGQTVAIIDSGIAWDHVALGGGFGREYRVVGGWDFTAEQDAVPYDDGPMGSHGTHVAGILAADTKTYTGVAPGVDLVALRVFNDQGAGYLEWVESALRWVHEHRAAFDNPITTVNLSLGTAQNSDSPPSWATLEDELAQLSVDGIFIAVAAGNRFGPHAVQGLSYPASSAHVVPVMSVDADGRLSDFSQRHERAIAAPGRRITSSVPDYVGNQNGRQDDFSSYTGTSMASPYVAGAGVLVREAMQFIGMDNVTQQTIYDHIRNTADTVYDSLSDAVYHRINVRAAIDALMPDDDYGSSADTSHVLGTLAQNTSLSGLIGSREDRDFFTFTAAHSGKVHLTARATHALLLDYGLIGAEGTVENDTFTFDVIAGQTYTVSLGTNSGIGYYDATIELVTNLVTFADNQIQVYGTSGDDVFEVVAGARVEVIVNGMSYVWDRSMVHGISVLGSGGFDELLIRSTAADDTAIFGPHFVSLRSEHYQLDAQDVDSVIVRGGGGNDRATLYDSEGDDRFVATTTYAFLRGPGFYGEAVGFPHVLAYSIRGGVDRAVLDDSTGDDQFVATVTYAFMRGPGYYNEAAYFEDVVGHAIHGGLDRAIFDDSSGNDRFSATPNDAIMQGLAFSTRVQQFEQVVANSIHGGADHAVLYDSAGSDVLTSGRTLTQLRGTGYEYLVRGFSRLSAYATAGSLDRAIFQDIVASDLFHAEQRMASRRTTHWQMDAWDFDFVTAIARSGETARTDAAAVDYEFERVGDWR